MEKMSPKIDANSPTTSGIGLKSMCQSGGIKLKLLKFLGVTLQLKVTIFKVVALKYTVRFASLYFLINVVLLYKKIINVNDQ